MRRGFTLIETIISIGLIVVIGTISIFSFNLIKKNKKENTLNSMSSEIYNAVNLYIETNKDIKEELYKNNNGIKIPLTTLENAGLVDFKDLRDNLNEDDFVVTMLGSTDPTDDTCAKTYTAKSWDINSGEKIYICEKADGTHNLAIINPTAVNNHTLVTNEKYYYTGFDPNNYIQLDGNNKKYRVLYVDTDDSVVLVSDSAFDSSLFNNIKMDLTTTTTTESIFYCNENTNKLLSSNILAKTTSDSLSTKVDLNDVINSSECIKYSVPTEKSEKYKNESAERINSVVYGGQGGASYTSGEIKTGVAYAYGYGYNKEQYAAFSWLVGNGNTCSSSLTDGTVKLTCNSFNNYKIHLNPCMKIKGGTGDFANPYVLKAVNCPN